MLLASHLRNLLPEQLCHSCPGAPASHCIIPKSCLEWLHLKPSLSPGLIEEAMRLASHLGCYCSLFLSFPWDMVSCNSCWLLDLLCSLWWPWIYDTSAKMTLTLWYRYASLHPVYVALVIKSRTSWIISKLFANGETSPQPFFYISERGGCQ